MSFVGKRRKRDLSFYGADRFLDEPQGNASSVFATSSSSTRFAIGYEIRFPEVCRTSGSQGSDIIAPPADWLLQSGVAVGHFTRTRRPRISSSCLPPTGAKMSVVRSSRPGARSVDVLRAYTNSGAEPVVADIDLDKAQNKEIFSRRRILHLPRSATVDRPHTNSPSSAPQAVECGECAISAAV
jgi:hypothetical protein